MQSFDEKCEENNISSKELHVVLVGVLKYSIFKRKENQSALLTRGNVMKIKLSLNVEKKF